MAWVDDLEGRIVGLDTTALIYFVEANAAYGPSVRPFFAALRSGRLSVVTSVVTLLEVLVQPLRGGDVALASRYRDASHRTPGLTKASVTDRVADEAARLRASYNLQTADAIQVATALDAGATAILTNDVRLSRVTELEVLVLDYLQDNLHA